jgi:hypothetical protein
MRNLRFSHEKQCLEIAPLFPCKSLVQNDGLIDDQPCPEPTLSGTAFNLNDSNLLHVAK